MINHNFLRSPLKYLKAKRKAKQELQLAIRQMTSSGLLRQIRIMERTG